MTAFTKIPRKFKGFLHVLAFAIALPVVLPAQTSTDEQLANLYFQEKDYEKAAHYFEKLFEAKPGNYFYQPYLTSLIELGDFKKAEKLVKKQIKTHPSNLSYQVDLGYVYRKSGEENDARQQYEKAIRQLPASQQDVLDLANAFLGKNETSFAVETYLHGRKMFMGLYTFNMELAEIYSKNGEYIKMFDEYLSLIELDPAFLQSVQNALQSKLNNDLSGERRSMLKNLLLRKIQKNPDMVVFAELLIWYYMQENQFGAALIQAKALDKRLREDGSRIIQLGEISTENQDYEVAAQCYEYIISKGKTTFYYTEAKVKMPETLYRKIAREQPPKKEDLEKLRDLYSETLHELGRGDHTALLARDLAHIQAFYLHNHEPALHLLQDFLSAPGVTKQNLARIKLELGDVYLLMGERWEATLLYSQVDKDFKNEILGHEAKLRNARLSYFMGDFNWARAQVDVLKAATSKLIANDALDLSLLITDNQDGDSVNLPLHLFARAEFLSFRNLDSLALMTLDTINNLYKTHALSDEVLFKRAHIMEKRGDYTGAAFFYQAIIENYRYDILADNALYRLAELQEIFFKDTRKAMDLYQQLMVEYPGSLFAVEARKRFRNLRGDKLN